MALSLDAVGALASTGPTLSPDRQKAAEEFEAYMVSFLAQQMRQSLPDGPMSTGPMSTFASLFDQEIGKRVAQGDSFGLKAELEQAFARAGMDPGSVRLPTAPGNGAHAIAALRHHGEELPPVSGAARRDPTPHDPAPGDALDGRITSHFGTRSDPFTHKTRSHQGTDFGAGEGTSIKAAAAGVVRFAGTRGGYGNVVIIDHPDGTQTRYGHCSELRVEAGQHVGKDTEIATVGHTGRATGPHLHFEVRENGVAVDPEAWLRRQ